MKPTIYVDDEEEGVEEDDDDVCEVDERSPLTPKNPPSLTTFHLLIATFTAASAAHIHLILKLKTDSLGPSYLSDKLTEKEKKMNEQISFGSGSVCGVNGRGHGIQFRIQSPSSVQCTLSSLNNYYHHRKEQRRKASLTSGDNNNTTSDSEGGSLHSYDVEDGEGEGGSLPSTTPSSIATLPPPSGEGPEVVPEKGKRPHLTVKRSTARELLSTLYAKMPRSNSDNSGNVAVVSVVDDGLLEVDKEKDHEVTDAMLPSDNETLERLPHIDHYHNRPSSARPTLQELHSSANHHDPEVQEIVGEEFGHQISMTATKPLGYFSLSGAGLGGSCARLSSDEDDSEPHPHSKNNPPHPSSASSWAAANSNNNKGGSTTQGKKAKGGGTSKLGWIQGVLVRCVLNILGVMLFLRLSWIAGQAGIILGSVIVLLASVVTTVTAISMCAICTNGEVKGGGAYFMISRSLGPEFGGSIGLIFAFANAVGAAMYVVGFAETLVNILQQNSISLFGDEKNDMRLVALLTIFLLILVVIIGLDFEAKAQIFLLGMLTVSIVNFYVGAFIPPSETKRAKGTVGFSKQLFLENLHPEWYQGYDFFKVFSVFFPAATGIMAGANISGDLKDAQDAIPKGTLWAIFITTLIYVSSIWLTGATNLRFSDGISLINNDSILTTVAGDSFDELFPEPSCKLNESCRYGLMLNTQVMEQESLFGPLITAGIFAATLSSALASLVSAPKIMQALSRDNLFPYTKALAYGYGKNDEPRRAYAVAFLIAILMSLIGDLDLIAPIISNFFLASYALINYACFDASFAKSPGFRPGFRYYSMWLSLFGAIICVLIMFLISWWAALITLTLIFTLYIYILRRKPDVNWGSSAQAHSYRQALQSMLKLAHTEEHVKNYRPQILVLTGNPVARPCLVDFVENITKDTSLLICGHVLVARNPERFHGTMKSQVRKIDAWLEKRKAKAFYMSVAAGTLSDGVSQLIQLSGLGKLRPNIAFLGYKADWMTAEPSAVLHQVFDSNMGICIFRVANGLDFSEQMKRRNHEDLMLLTPPVPPIYAGLAAAAEMITTVSSGNELKNRQQPCRISDQYRRQKNHPDASILMKEMQIAQQSLQASMSQFKTRIPKGTIDVWWLYDDGGLSLLLPHLLAGKGSYLEGAILRVFTIARTSSQLEQEQRSMVGLLNKFRIDCKHVFVLPNVMKPPKDSTLKTFENIIENFRIPDDELKSAKTSPTAEDGTTAGGEYETTASIQITDTELAMHKDRTHRHLRTRELLLENSQDASLIVLTLPIPRKGVVSPSLFLSWLELLTKDMPPILLIRGNQQSVLTFYS